MKFPRRFAILASAALAIAPASEATGAVIMNATQAGGDVIVTGSGSLNLAAWGTSGGGFFGIGRSDRC